MSVSQFLWSGQRHAAYVWRPRGLAAARSRPASSSTATAQTLPSEYSAAGSTSCPRVLSSSMTSGSQLRSTASTFGRDSCGVNDAEKWSVWKASVSVAA